MELAASRAKVKDRGRRDFTRQIGPWSHQSEGRIRFSVPDRDGAPDPDYVALIPGLIAQLPALEALAREAFDFKSIEHSEEEAYELVLVYPVDTRWVLVFGEAGDENSDSVEVTISEGKVIDVSSPFGRKLS